MERKLRRDALLHEPPSAEPGLCSTDAVASADGAASSSASAAVPLAGGADVAVTVLSTLARRASPHGVLGFFTMREACALRLVNAEFRDTIAAHPWVDVKTVVSRSLSCWRASFAGALAVNVSSGGGSLSCAMSPADAALLRGVPLVVPLRGAPIAGDLRAWRAAHPAAATAILDGRLDVCDADLAALRGVRGLSLRVCSQDVLTAAALEPLRGRLIALDVRGCSVAFITGCIARFSLAHEAGILADALFALRSLMSAGGDDRPVDAIIAEGVLPRLVELLGADACPRVQHEVAWVLTNLTATEQHTPTVVAAGAVPALVRLLSSPHDAVRVEAVWVLGNIAAHGPEERDAVLAAGIFEPLLQACEPGHKTLARTAAATISSLVCNKPLPAPAIVAQLLLRLAALLATDDPDTLHKTLRAMGYILLDEDGCDESREVVVAAGCVPRIVSLVRHTEPAVAFFSVHIVRLIVDGGEAHVQAVIDAGALPLLAEALFGEDGERCMEANLALEKVLAGSAAQVQAAIDVGAIPLWGPDPIEGSVRAWRAGHPLTVCASLAGRRGVRVEDIAALRGVRGLSLRGCGQDEDDEYVLSAAALEPLRGDLVAIDLCGCSLYLVADCITRWSPLREAGILADAVRALRVTLGNEDVDPSFVNSAIKMGLLPRLVACLGADSCPRLQHEAAWVLARAAGAEHDLAQVHASEIVTAGAVPALVQLLASPRDAVREQAVWALGNVAAHGPALRNAVLAAGVIEPLLCVFALDAHETLLGAQAAAMASLVCVAPPPAFAVVAPLLPRLSQLVRLPCKNFDDEFHVDALTALADLADGSDEQVRAVLDTECVSTAVGLLDHRALEIASPALRIVEACVRSDRGGDGGVADAAHHAAIDAVLDAGALQPVVDLLLNDSWELRKGACAVLAGICAGKGEHAQAVIDAGAVPTLVELTTDDEPLVVEAAQRAVAAARGHAAGELLPAV